MNLVVGLIFYDNYRVHLFKVKLALIGKNQPQMYL